MNQSALDAWKAELASRYHSISQKEDEKLIRIKIGNSERFAVEKKTEYIYGMSHNRIKKKECYGKLDDWTAWEWAFFPYRKSLCDWMKDVKKPEVHKPRRKRTSVRKKRGSKSVQKENSELDHKYENRSWPYTEHVGRPPRSTGENNQPMGEGGTPMARLGSEGSTEKTGRGIPEKRGRKGLRA